MDELKIFVSVGGTANDKQESFIRAVEERLRSESLIPMTVGRNKFSSDSPLKAVIECLNESSGVIIIALERTYFPSGLEKRGGSKELELINRKYATPWNQIEAALSYSKGLPIMVIVEEGVQEEGLLEKENDWYVMSVKLETATLNSNEFNGVLSDWKRKIQSSKSKTLKTASKIEPTELTIGDILKSLKPNQLWAILATMATLLAGAFALGAKLFITK